jgi:hypothetical protein
LSISSILNKIGEVASSNNIGRPHIVGGIPRDYVIDRSKTKTTDVDITTNTPDSMRLGVLVADDMGKWFRVFNRGNLKLMLDDYSVDFSSNFISENVINFFKSKECDKYKCPAFPEIEDTLMEVYSRDFTINTLHQDIETFEIIDFLDRGINDIKNKIIRTPVPASITIYDDPRRIYRAIYFSSKYQFEVDDEIIEYVSSNKSIVMDESIKDTFITSKVNAAIDFDEDNTIELLNKMGILGKTPLVGSFKDSIISKKIMLDYLDDEQNYRLHKL